MAKKAEPRDLIKATTKDKVYEGYLMPRSEITGQGYVTLKLKSGYDIGLKEEDIREIKVLEKAKPLGSPPEEKLALDPKKPNVSIIATGGTIASRVDYLTGGVHSAFKAEELINAVPEMGDIANITGRQAFNKFSENMQPKDWIELAKAVHEEIEGGADGIVITHGTDTMGYSAAALSFMLKTPVPIVFTGAQRSSDRGSSDAAMNLIHATLVAASADLSGVYVVMHHGPDDTSSAIHYGTNVRKLHSSKRDAFRSVNRNPAGIVEENEARLSKNPPKRGGDLAINSKLGGKVAMIKYYPGMDEKQLRSALAGLDGAIIEGTGLGHIAESLMGPIEEAIAAGTLIFMGTQAINGRINMNVYSTGRRLMQAGVNPLKDMLTETAYVKLLWAFGNSSDNEGALALMKEDISGEYDDRIPP